MVAYDLNQVENAVLDICRFPIPRTPIEIAKTLKKTVPSFYPRTDAARTVATLRANTLKPLEEKGLIVRYAPKLPQWARARRMLSYHHSKVPGKSPRKVAELYQINFLFLGKDSQIQRLPSLPEINLDLVILFYNFSELMRLPFYTWELINLFYSFSFPEHRDKIRIKLHQLNFTDRERSTLEKALEYYPEFSDYLGKFPFRPDPGRALQLLEKL